MDESTRAGGRRWEVVDRVQHPDSLMYEAICESCGGFQQEEMQPPYHTAMQPVMAFSIRLFRKCTC